jgi:hypothetical protein
MIVKIDEERRVEIVSALKERMDALKKLRKTTEDRECSTTDIDEKLALYRPSDWGPGLREYFGYQTELDMRPENDTEREVGGVETGGGHPAGATVSPSTEEEPVEAEWSLLPAGTPALVGGEPSEPAE